MREVPLCDPREERSPLFIIIFQTKFILMRLSHVVASLSKIFRGKIFLRDKIITPMQTVIHKVRSTCSKYISLLFRSQPRSTNYIKIQNTHTSLRRLLSNHDFVIQMYDRLYFREMQEVVESRRPREIVNIRCSRDSPYEYLV